MLKLMDSPSASEAVTVPIAVWFSAALKVADEVIDGTRLTYLDFTVWTGLIE